MLEKFYLPQTFLSCRHALIGAAQVFAFLGQNFVAALGLFDHVFPLDSFSAEPNGSQSMNSLIDWLVGGIRNIQRVDRNFTRIP
jgi:hypothetical protein